MAHITGHDRSQTLLLPESLDDYVGPDNPVRFMASMVATDVGPYAAVSMGTISLSQMSKARIGPSPVLGDLPDGTHVSLRGGRAKLRLGAGDRGVWEMAAGQPRRPSLA
jgi:hypothetical protein